MDGMEEGQMKAGGRRMEEKVGGWKRLVGGKISCPQVEPAQAMKTKVGERRRWKEGRSRGFSLLTKLLLLLLRHRRKAHER